jgi:hypothetical protein
VVERDDLDRHALLDGGNREDRRHYHDVFLSLQQGAQRRRRARALAHAHGQILRCVKALFLGQIEVRVLALELPAEAHVHGVRRPGGGGRDQERCQGSLSEM